MEISAEEATNIVILCGRVLLHLDDVPSELRLRLLRLADGELADQNHLGRHVLYLYHLYK